MTLAPYVLRSTNLEPRINNEDGGTRAYRPWFESGSWTGDLIEYEITKDGKRVVRDDIGRYPRDGDDWRGPQELWSARYAFPDYEAYDQSLELDPTWECTEEDVDYWKTRYLFTVTNGAKAAFLWNELSAAQRQALDPPTASSPDRTLDTDPYASDLLNFIRGDRSNERCKENGNYRWRFSLLGAIVNSMPVHVPAGADGLVVVGANDGILHGFNAADGTELFGYVPSMLLDSVGALRISPYRPRHFVDGELRYRDVGTASQAKHVVSGGLGAGGKGLFVLDVTSPGSPTVIRELAGTNAAHNGGSYDGRLGHIRGRPTIARLPDGTSHGRWHVIAGNGYGSDTGTAQLVLVPIDGGTVEFLATDATDENGLSAPSLVDANGDGIVDYAYAGDLKGNLWRFDMTYRTVSRLFSAGAGKPITVEPDVSRHPGTRPGFMIYFGTGSLLSAADISATGQQTIYGIWDRADGASVSANRLVTQTLVTDTVTWSLPEGSDDCINSDLDESTATVRFIVDQQRPDWTGDTPNLGWQVDLPRQGERLVGHPQIRAGRVQFTTINPYDMVDDDRSAAEGSGSWILQLDLASGGNAEQTVPLFDLNKNCTLDKGDSAPDELVIGSATVSAGTFPVGVNLGAFNIAQPSFARVRYNPVLRSVVDGVYINALQLPRVGPSSEPPHGPLDVVTDSAFGPAHWSSLSAPWKEPWKQPFGKRQFPEASGPTKPFIRADGLGHRVDGHSFGYNHHHGVNYVDLLDLEPQRDTWRLDIGAVYKAANGTYPRLAPSVSERELNRVTEVGIAANQRFIGVVANADLSRENVIQIGCRAWPVYEYQTIMMRALRKAPAEMMADLVSQGLVFTLSGDYNPIRPSSGSTVCADSGSISTIRITPTERIGALDATMATLPGCVNNTDRYQGSPPNAHLTRKSGILASDGTLHAGKGPADLYADAPHVTVNREGTGYRWRNGALTVQLLAVNGDNTPAFTLQDASHLPRGNGVEGQDRGFGGAYARAFTVGSPQNRITPLTDGLSQPGTSTSGMLYELAMFWHWGDMTRFQQQGGGSPVSAFCYGASGNTAPALMFETDSFTPGAYGQVTAELTDAVQQEYVGLLADLRSNDPVLVEDALTRLAELFDEIPGLIDYHRLRHYVRSSRQLQEHHLIDIDSGGLGSEAVDGTPANVIDIERDLLPSLGPNYRLGRRSWIDLTPQTP